MKLLYIFLISITLFSYLFSQNLDSIEELINKQEYKTIIHRYSIYEMNITSYPKINYYLAISHFKTGNYNKAELIFSELIKKGYKLVQVYFNLGVTKYKLKKFKEAIKYLNIAKNSDATFSAECMYIMISCYLKQDNKLKAIKIYKELVEKFPFSLQVFKSQELLESYKINVKKTSLYQLPKVNFYISTEYGYDNNINMISIEQLSGKSDNYYGTMVNILVNHKKFTILSTFEKVLFSSFTNYNSDICNLTLRYGTHTTYLGIFGKYSKYEQPFNYELGAELKISLQQYFFPFNLKFIYSNEIYLDYTELNATIYQATLETTHFDNSYNFSVGFSIKNNISQQIFSYYSLIPSIRYSQKILKFLTINTTLNYEVKNYDWKRKDNLLNLNFYLSIIPFKNLEILPSLAYTDCSSNLNYLSYKKTDLSISLNLYF